MIALAILFFGTIYVLIVLLTAYWLSLIPRRQKIKTWTQILTVLVFALIPTWDIILGRLYFNYLCETESGIKIYKQMELPAEYWDENGESNFITSRGDLDQSLLDNRFDKELERESVSDIARLLNIRKYRRMISRAQSNEMLGAYVRFVYFGGWLVNSTGIHVTGTSCPPTNEYDTRNFINQVFRPANSKEQGVLQ